MPQPSASKPTLTITPGRYTRAIGVRENDRVKYVGDASTVLRHILIDFTLLQVTSFFVFLVNWTVLIFKMIGKVAVGSCSAILPSTFLEF